MRSLERKNTNQNKKSNENKGDVKNKLKKTKNPPSQKQTKTEKTTTETRRPHNYPRSLETRREPMIVSSEAHMAMTHDPRFVKFKENPTCKNFSCTSKKKKKKNHVRDCLLWYLEFQIHFEARIRARHPYHIRRR